MAKTLLYELIQNYVRKHDHGIFLLPVPTGYGKTYSSIDYITDQVIVSHERTDKPKFIFVTNLKKNLKNSAAHSRDFSRELVSSLNLLFQ